MKTTYITLLVIGLFIASIVLSIVPNKCYSDIISSVSGIVSAFATVTTLIVALLLYNRFKIDQHILDKQGEKVIGLFTTIRKKHFRIKVPGVGETSTLLLWVDVIRNDKRKEEFKNAALFVFPTNFPLLFNDSYLTYIKDVAELLRDDYIPKIISAKMKEYEYLAFVDPVEQEQNYGKVETDNTEDDYHGKWEILLVENLIKKDQNEITLHQFIDQWADVANTIEKWIKINAPAAYKTLELS